MQADQHVLEHGDWSGRRWCAGRCARGRASRSRAASDRSATCRDNAPRPALGRMKPVMTLKAVVLPAPLGPIRLTISPWFDREAHVGDRDQAAEMHRDVLDRQRRGCDRVRLRRRRSWRVLPLGCAAPGPRGSCVGARRTSLRDRRHDALAAGRRRSGSSARRRGSTAPRATRTPRSTSGSSPKIRPPTIGPASVPLPPVIDHDHHRHGVDEQEDVRVDDAHDSARRGCRPRRRSRRRRPWRAPGSA